MPAHRCHGSNINDISLILLWLLRVRARVCRTSNICIKYIGKSMDVFILTKYKDKTRKSFTNHGPSYIFIHQSWTIIYIYICRPRWLSWMRVRLETRRSRVRPPPRSVTFFREDLIMKYCQRHSLPSADSRRAVVRFWRKNVHNTC